MAESKNARAKREAAEREDEHVEAAEAARQDKDTEDTTVPSVVVGPNGEHEGADSGASDPQAHRSRLPSTEDEMDEVAENVAQSVLPSIAPARAREEAQAARYRASGSDFQQSKIELRLAELLDDLADRHDREGNLLAERSKLLNGRNAQLSRAGIASGSLGTPLPDSVVRGSPVVVHQPTGRLDQFGFVTRLWPAVADNPDEPDSPKRRWRADVVSFPLGSGGSSHAEGVAHGTGVGQFELVDDLDEDDEAAVAERDTRETPWRHEIR